MGRPSGLPAALTTGAPRRARAQTSRGVKRREAQPRSRPPSSRRLNRTRETATLATGGRRQTVEACARQPKPNGAGEPDRAASARVASQGRRHNVTGVPSRPVVRARPGCLAGRGAVLPRATSSRARYPGLTERCLLRSCRGPETSGRDRWRMRTGSPGSDGRSCDQSARGNRLAPGRHRSDDRSSGCRDSRSGVACPWRAPARREQLGVQRLGRWHAWTQLAVSRARLFVDLFVESGQSTSTIRIHSAESHHAVGRRAARTDPTPRGRSRFARSGAAPSCAARANSKAAPKCRAARRSGPLRLKRGVGPRARPSP